MKTVTIMLLTDFRFIFIFIPNKVFWTEIFMHMNFTYTATHCRQQPERSYHRDIECIVLPLPGPDMYQEDNQNTFPLSDHYSFPQDIVLQVLSDC